MRKMKGSIEYRALYQQGTKHYFLGSLLGLKIGPEVPLRSRRGLEGEEGRDEGDLAVAGEGELAADFKGKGLKVKESPSALEVPRGGEVGARGAGLTVSTFEDGVATRGIEGFGESESAASEVGIEGLEREKGLTKALDAGNALPSAIVGGGCGDFAEGAGSVRGFTNDCVDEGAGDCTAPSPVACARSLARLSIFAMEAEFGGNEEGEGAANEGSLGVEGGGGEEAGTRE